MLTNQQRTPVWKQRSFRSIPRLKGGKINPHSRRGGGRGESRFRAGEVVKETGIYEVLHDGDHREAHEVVMLREDFFPPCDTCQERVSFRLVRTAPYIFQDEDFEE